MGDVKRAMEDIGSLLVLRPDSIINVDRKVLSQCLSTLESQAAEIAALNREKAEAWGIRFCCNSRDCNCQGQPVDPPSWWFDAQELPEAKKEITTLRQQNAELAERIEILRQAGLDFTRSSNIDVAKRDIELTTLRAQVEELRAVREVVERAGKAIGHSPWPRIEYDVLEHEFLVDPGDGPGGRDEYPTLLEAIQALATK